MISYCWAQVASYCCVRVVIKSTYFHLLFCLFFLQQLKIKEVHECLVKLGFDVWLDMYDMSTTGGGNLLEAMSAAIDNADVVLIAVSREYRDSANCRLEAEDAHTRKKKTMFLMMQEDFTSPSGWLGMLIGAKLWYPFFGPEPTPKQVEYLRLAHKNAA